MHEIAIPLVGRKTELCNLIGTFILTTIPSVIPCYCVHTLGTIDLAGHSSIFSPLSPLVVDTLLNSKA